MTSKIKVDNINKVSDDSNIIKKCGTTTTIGSGASNPIVVDGSAVTLGRCGGTVALASGATQTGFGRTGTVDWQTTPKTGDFTGANGEGYFINTTSGEITMTLPSASAGDIISIQDYNNTFDSNSFRIQAGSGVKINGGDAAGALTLNTEGQGLTLIYVDSTVGWRSIESTTFNTTSIVPTFITATGGTITTSGNCKIHTFTGPGTFAVPAVSNVADNNQVSYMVIAGGGGGGASRGGGGGAGGFRETKSPVTPYTASPLDGQPSAPNRITVTATSFPITVGGGGAGQPAPPANRGTKGSSSVFSTITSTGGGSGRDDDVSLSAPSDSGGSGGGAGGGAAPENVKGEGNTPPVTPSQGNPGADSITINSPPANPGGGGGGATAPGKGPGPGGTPSATADGGAGATTSINATPTVYAGGGGGGVTGSGGSGGGGDSGAPSGGAGNAGTTNTGGGGGGGSSHPYGGGAGGSGIVIIRYKFQ